MQPIGFKMSTETIPRGYMQIFQPHSADFTVVELLLSSYEFACSKHQT